MTDQETNKRQKLMMEGGGNSSRSSLSEDPSPSSSSYSVVVVADGAREITNFNVPKRSVFQRALLTKPIPEKSTFSGMPFRNISSSVVNAYKLRSWALSLGASAVVEIFYGAEKEGPLLVSCQLQFLSKGNVERDGQIMTEKEAKIVETADPSKYKCISFFYPSFNGFWTETTEQIRVILTFSSQIQLMKPMINEDALVDSYLPSFESYFLSDDLSDISVSSNSTKYPAHKMVLSHCSDVFKRLVQTDMKENREKNIKLDEFDPRAVKEMLRFVYTGKFESTPEMTHDLFKLGHTYQIKGLKRIILPLVLRCITPETAPRMFTFGEIHAVPAIMRRALAIGKSNKESLVKDVEKFKTLTLTYPNFMFQLFMQD